MADYKDDFDAENANCDTAVVLPFPRKRSTAHPFEFWTMAPWKMAVAMNCAWIAVAYSTWPFARPRLLRAASTTGVVVPFR